MSKELNKGINLNTAIDYLEKKKTRKTSYNSKMIAELWNTEARTRAFFSARVAKADLLDAFRHHTEQILKGKSTTSQARDWIKEFLKTDGNNALSECGFLPVNEQNVLQELGSTRRINLILEQNVRQSQSVGEYRQAQMEKDIIPYMQYNTRNDGKVRSSHQALHKKIYKVDNPIWEQIYPPNDFLCRCFIRRLTKRQAEGLIISRKLPKDLINEPLSKSGYAFDVSKGMNEALMDKPTWSELLKKKYKKDVAPFLKSQIRVLENQREVWERELFKAKTPSYKILCQNTIDNIDKTLKSFGITSKKLKLNKISKTAQNDIKKVEEYSSKQLGMKLNCVALGITNAKVIKEVAERLKELKDEGYEFYYKHFGKTSKSTAYASSSTFQFNISLKFANNKRSFIKTLKTDASYGFHPVGCDTIKSVVDHEFAHMLTSVHLLKVDGKYTTFRNEIFNIKRKYHTAINELKKKHKISIFDIRNKRAYAWGIEPELEKKAINNFLKDFDKIAISGYAEQNLNEFIAESFAMVKNNKNPSPFALEIYNLINKRFKK